MWELWIDVEFDELYHPQTRSAGAHAAQAPALRVRRVFRRSAQIMKKAIDALRGERTKDG